MIIFLNRVPTPNLRQYCYFSLGSLFLIVIYAQKLFRDLLNEEGDLESSDLEATMEWNGMEADNHGTFYKVHGNISAISRIILNEPWCIWVLINFSYCCLILFSKIIQELIFGKLRVVENQHIKDQFWNFIFLKFIFIFGVLNLEEMNEVIRWCVWFSLIGFLSIHSQICKDRFEYLSFSASTPFKSHLKVLILLLFIQIGCALMLSTPFTIASTIGFSTFLFLFAESLGLFLRTLYVITRYGIHLCDVNNLIQLNNKSTTTYYIDFSFEISVVALDFMHNLHMLVYGNFYLSMASLVICMELKRLFIELKRRLRRHANYLRVIEKMEKKFPWASQEEMIDLDKCAVCWEKLDQARKLPCSHIFHQNCLRSWLEQDTSCPTCRKSLQDEKEPQQAQPQQPQQPTAMNANSGAENPVADNQGQPQNAGANTRVAAGRVQRNVFHFDGPRYISWLPSFSLQVTNGHGLMLPDLLRRRQQALTQERLNSMTEQISQLFPHIPVELVQQDLRQTFSVEITIENILENRLMARADGQGNFANEQGRGSLDGNDESDDTDYEDMDNSIRNTLGSFADNLFNNSPTGNNAERRDESESVPLNVTDDSNIIAKYPDVPGMSEKATTLTQRKRELILSSKRRYLERISTSESSHREDHLNSKPSSPSGSTNQSEKTD